MKRFLIVMILLLSACSNDPLPDPMTQNREEKWTIIKSPITQECYEMALLSFGGGPIRNNYSGMAKISCDLYKQ